MRYTIADLVRVAQALDDAERMRAELAEFADTADFFDVRTGDAFNIPPEQAMAYFRAKGLKTSYSYADALGEANDAAFTVAKMMDVDMLGMVRASLDSAMANGVSFGEWRKELTPILQAAGWWGKSTITDPATGVTERAQLGSAWRLETIFRTNMQAAYAQGHWRQIEEQAEVAPFLMYDAVDDFRTRPLHNSWDNKVLPVTSAWWKTHYPPNGYNCRCGVIQLDGRQLRDMGISVQPEPPDDGEYQWTNPRTGDKQMIPNGIDPGFNRSPGGYSADLRTLMREKVQALPDDMAEAVALSLIGTLTLTGSIEQAALNELRHSPEWQMMTPEEKMQAVRERAREMGR
jgi:SPP1 gp7 family putative phage head morphogenesis protein